MKSQIQDLSDAIASQLQTQQEQRSKRWETAFWVFGALVGLIALFLFPTLLVPARLYSSGILFAWC